MRLAPFFRPPTLERLVRTVFWTFVCLALLFYGYGMAAEQWGLGLYVHNHPWVPKLHMRIEVRVNDVLSNYADIGLVATALLVALWSRKLAGFGLLLFVFLSIKMVRY